MGSLAPGRAPAMHSGAPSNPPGRRSLGRAKTRPKLCKGPLRRAVTSPPHPHSSGVGAGRRNHVARFDGPCQTPAPTADGHPCRPVGASDGPWHPTWAYVSCSGSARCQAGGRRRPFGNAAEHLKLLLQDVTALELLAHACTRLANAQVPADVVAGLAMSRLTALQKPGGGVRGIATGDCFRRLVSRALAKGWADTFDEATRPYQFALQARAGADALAAHVRTARAAFLAGLRSCAPELLPFVRLFYGGQSSYCWWDAEGRCRDVAQGEGCEQGDPLAPALFALGQHSALCSAASALHPAETLVAFLDDLYTTRGRARECRDTVVGAVERDCGIASNIGKTRVYAPTKSPPPPGVAELGPDVWRADKPLAERGLKVLGVPIGHAEYVRAWAEARMQEEQELLDQLPQLPDLQCAWLLLAMCAAPRANHALRTVPPTMVAPYAKMHDDAIWDTLDALLGGLSPDETASARALAELPASLGGLGLHGFRPENGAGCLLGGVG